MKEKTDEYYMREALKEAEKAKDMDEVPVGAVVVCNGKIIARAHNLRESTLQANAHAEMLALQKAAKKKKNWCLNDCDLYVTLEPCMMCSGAISLYRIQTLYYGTKDLKGGTVNSLLELKSIRHVGTYPKEIQSGILEEECGRILTDFFREKRKKPKKNPMDLKTFDTCGKPNKQ